MPASNLPTVPVVDGACPFDNASIFTQSTTPATHFALAAGPASDTAVLLPFAQHRWHSRLVAALRDDARETHGKDATAANFVLVALPEQARPKVIDLLVEVLELRREDRHTETGLAETVPECYKAVVVGVFPACSPTEKSCLDPTTVASLCQLCRLCEFLQLSIGVDLACFFIAPWVKYASASDWLPFLSTALESACREDDLTAPALNVEAGVPPPSRHLRVESDLVSGLRAHASTVHIGRAPVGPIPKMFFDILPPGAIPGAVLDSRLQCYLPDSDASVPVCCGTASSSPSVVYVTAATEVASLHSDCFAVFGSGPEAIEDFRRLATASAIFLSIRLPTGLTVEELKSPLIRTCRRIILPPDVTDDNVSEFLDACVQTSELDLSMTKITTIPPRCFLPFKELHTVYLPPTLKTIGPIAFPDSVKEVTGVGPGVDVEALSFLFPTEVREAHIPRLSWVVVD